MLPLHAFMWKSWDDFLEIKLVWWRTRLLDFGHCCQTFRVMCLNLIEHQKQPRKKVKEIHVKIIMNHFRLSPGTHYFYHQIYSPWKWKNRTSRGIFSGKGLYLIRSLEIWRKIHNFNCKLEKTFFQDERQKNGSQRKNIIVTTWSSGNKWTSCCITFNST